MKRPPLILLLFCFTGLIYASPRIKVSINESWKFNKEDVPNLVKPEFDDSEWQLVNFPHTWNADDPENEVRIK